MLSSIFPLFVLICVLIAGISTIDPMLSKHYKYHRMENIKKTNRLIAIHTLATFAAGVDQTKDFK